MSINWDKWNEIARITGGYNSSLAKGESDTLSAEEISEINATAEKAFNAIKRAEYLMDLARARFRTRDM